MLQIKFMGTYEIAVRWMPQNTFDAKSTLVQVRIWCHQATSHYLTQCWCQVLCCYIAPLTHWGRVTHLYIIKLTTIGSDNGLSPGHRQAIIWTNAGILLIGPIGTNVSEILIEINTFSLRKMYLKMSSGKWRPFCLGLNVLNNELNKVWICSTCKNT